MFQFLWIWIILPKKLKSLKTLHVITVVVSSSLPYFVRSSCFNYESMLFVFIQIYTGVQHDSYMTLVFVSCKGPGWLNEF